MRTFLFFLLMPLCCLAQGSVSRVVLENTSGTNVYFSSQQYSEFSYYYWNIPNGTTFIFYNTGYDMYFWFGGVPHAATPANYLADYADYCAGASNVVINFLYQTGETYPYSPNTEYMDNNSYNGLTTGGSLNAQNLQELLGGVFTMVLLMVGVQLFMCYRLGRMGVVLAVVFFGLGRVQAQVYVYVSAGGWNFEGFNGGCYQYYFGGGAAQAGGCVSQIPQYGVASMSYLAGAWASSCGDPNHLHYTASPGLNASTPAGNYACATNWVATGAVISEWVTNIGSSSFTYSVAGPNGNLICQPSTLSPGGVVALSGFPAGSYLVGASVTNSAASDGSTVYDPLTSQVATGSTSITNWVPSGGGTNPVIPSVNGSTNVYSPVTVQSGQDMADTEQIVSAIQGISTGSGSGLSSAAIGVLTNSASLQTGSLSNLLSATTNVGFVTTNTVFVPNTNLWFQTNVALGFPLFVPPSLSPVTPTVNVPFSALNDFLPPEASVLSDITMDWSTNTVWSTLVPLFRGFMLLLLTIGFVFLCIRTIKGVAS